MNGQTRAVHGTAAQAKSGSHRMLGLALGGGGALGAAHVGVLRALHEAGLAPRVVVGTSAGSLVGAAYAAGLSPSQIDAAVRGAEWSMFGRLRPSPRLGLLDSSALLETIDRLGGEPLIETLPRRFAAIATDLRTRQAVILDRGRLGIALRASIAVPGIFPPIVVGDQILVDGGLAANLPIAAAQQLGATFTIAVRIRPEWDRIPAMRSTRRIAALEASPDVLMIRPKLNGLSQWSRADVPQIIDTGYVAARTALEVWKGQRDRVA
ncbi:MAG: patatin-like phospholipase family protein [Microbacterium sp.]|uniref:patatin-like phospholipase family protein n=1 Tax=Microbacterium sp. TaxID=51671 RepID=UPI00271BE31A|nr:patatin-like phospholipase family protein [Microbacterium sp.]MDO8383853.1 patatin-like phospholipase family protein [Microbacterium sp.]